MLEQFIETLVNNGYLITVDQWDGQEYLIYRSADLESIMAAVENGDYIIVYTPDHKRAFSIIDIR